MARFRVDRNKSRTKVPCGMNSIIYVGDQFNVAYAIFKESFPGIDEWGQVDKLYCVTLAEWSSFKKDYIVSYCKVVGQGRLPTNTERES